MSTSSASGRGEKTKKVVEKVCNCLTCGMNIKDKDPGLQCEACAGWCHAACEDVSDEVLEVLQRDNIHWYCLSCNKSISKVYGFMTKLQQKQDRMEEEIKDIENPLRDG